MGIFSKSFSFSRYFVLGETPVDFFSWVDSRLQKYHFLDIDDTSDEKSIGWVGVGNLLETEFSSGQAHKGEYLTFSLRLDSRKVPAALFRKHYQLAETIQMQQQKNRPLGRNQKVELKKTVMQNLLRRQMPQPNLVDVVWHAAKQRLWLFATSPKIREEFETLFRETFEMDLYLLFPYTLAQSLVSQESGLALDELSPSNIFDKGGKD